MSRPAMQPDPPAGDGGESAASPGPLRILLAEDQELNARIITFFLEQDRHEVVLAGNGREALAVLARERFDLVVMDVQMPVMDGIETVRRIRAASVPGVDPFVPVIALTAHVSRDDRDSLIAAGMDEYIAKPLDLELFRAAVARISQNRPRCLAGEGYAGPATDNDADLDYDGLVGKFAGNAAAVRELLHMYLDAEPGRMRAVMQAALDRDPARLADESHALAGIAAPFGFAAVTRACRELERLAQAGDERAWPDALAALKTACERTGRAVQARLESKTGPA